MFLESTYVRLVAFPERLNPAKGKDVKLVVKRPNKLCLMIQKKESI